MSKAFKAMWLGDNDPNAQTVTIGGLTFVKGEAVNVPADNEMANKIRNNPTFAVDDAKAEPVEAVEPEPVDPEIGTEKAALKNEIERLGGERPKGNPSVDTLRNTLAKLAEKANG